MSQQKYVYNRQTLQYEKFKKPVLQRIQNTVLIILGLLFGSFVMQYVLGVYFPTANEQKLVRELNQLSYRYAVLNDKTDIMEDMLTEVQKRDREVHRLMFGMDPIDEDIWNGGVGGHDRFDDLVDYNAGTTQLIKRTQDRVDRLQHQLTIQTRSLDTLYTLASEKEKMLSSIPSIKPVQESKLKSSMRMMSGYGWRIHPVHKVKKMHKGIDFTAPKGTPIQATGDGIVKQVKNKRRGYGKHVIIDHGYGYTTLYAHMKTIDVRPGQRVKKGQKIGLIGSTGTSTAPHLHYEVRFKGRSVNPIHYCMDGLSPEEYEELVDRASIQNQSFD